MTVSGPTGVSWGTSLILEETPHQWLVLIHNPDGTEYALNQWTGIDISETFEGPHTTIEVNSLDPALPYITELETDLLWFRNNVLLYRMRVVDSEDVFTRDAHLVRYECSSYEKLLERRLILTDWVLVDEDLDAAWRLVDYAQQPESFGITRDPLAVGGVTRQRTLDAGDTVYEAINDFAEADDGFDWWIDQHLVWHAQKPRKGSILSDEWQWGAEAAEITRQAPLEDYSSFVMATGATSETRIPDGSGGETVYPPPPPQFVELPVKNLGYWAKSVAYSDVVTVASLAEKARFNLNDLANMRPTYNITLEPGIWNPGYKLGDVLYLRVQSPPRHDFRVLVRIEELHISCSPDGQEVVEVSARAEESETEINPNPGYSPNGRTIPRRRLHAWDDVAALLQDFDQRTGRLERVTIFSDGGGGGGGTGITDGPKGDITVSGSGSNWQINADTVGANELANMPTQTIKGRVSAGTGNPEDLTAAQATSLLNTFTTTLKGLVPPPGGAAATDVLRANQTWGPGGSGTGTDEVWVGADDPIATTPTIELWYDSDDEPAAADNANYWNSAWGVVGAASGAGADTTYSSASDIPGMTVTWNAVGGRRYRTTATAMFGQTVAASAATSIGIADAANTTYRSHGTTIPVNTYENLVVQQIDEPPTSAAMTRKARIDPGGGTAMYVGSFTRNGWIVVEDMGPVTKAAVNPPAGQPTVATAGNALGIVATGTFRQISGLAQPNGTVLTNPLAFTPLVGRRYVLHLRIRAISITVDGHGYMRILRDGTAAVDTHISTVTGQLGFAAIAWPFDGDGAAHSYTADFNSPTFTPYLDMASSHFYIEDVGPNQAPALPIPETPPAWTVVTNFLNGWSNYSAYISGYVDAGYRKIGDIVQLRGTVRNGTSGAAIFTLPVGFRPPKLIYVPSAISTGASYVQVRDDASANPGNVVPYPHTAAWVDLSGISFSVTP